MSKPDASFYFWRVVTSQNPSSAVDNRTFPPEATLEILLEEIRKLARSNKGATGFSLLRLFFIILDKNSKVNDGKIDIEDISRCLGSSFN